LIVKDNKLVFEEYFPGYNSSGIYVEYERDTLHGIASCTKSITSCLTGIAFDSGLLHSLDQKLYSFFPEFTDLQLNERKQRISLEDMLTMRGGLEWDEWSYPYDDMRNTLVQLWEAPNVYHYVFELPDIAEPGTIFLYNSGLSICMGGIVEKVTGMALDEYAEKKLFTPLGIDQYRWMRRYDGVIQSGGGLALRPRDMAKFGQLYLNKGLWDGVEIVSEDWVNTSLTNHTGSAGVGNGIPTDGYGFNWWIQEWGFHDGILDSFFARGYGGQIIMGFPEINLIIVLTGGHYTEGTEQCYYMIGNEILPAIRDIQ
jgi:CubicO group peptidase (beta-lactamase class C family)